MSSKIQDVRNAGFGACLSCVLFGFSLGVVSALCSYPGNQISGNVAMLMICFVGACGFPTFPILSAMGKALDRVDAELKGHERERLAVQDEIDTKLHNNPNAL